MFGDDYIRQIGSATENLAKAALAHLLHAQYVQEQPDVDETEVDFLLQAVRNTELGSQSTSKDSRAFASENRQLVRDRVRRLPIGQRTLVYSFLYEDYVKKQGLDQAQAAISLAAAVTNKVFGELPTGANDNNEFAGENEEFIETRASKLASNNELCVILTGAAYNTSYARYVNAGGNRGIFSNKFLAYIRALSALARGDSSLGMMSGKLAAEISHDLGPRILTPLESIWSLDIFRALSHNPDERQFYQAVYQFAIRAGVQLKRPSAT